MIEEFGSTTVVFPGQFMEVDPHGILIVREKVTALSKGIAALFLVPPAGDFDL